MNVLKIETCAVCAWTWARRLYDKRGKLKPEPRRCPNHDCRSTKWKGDK